MRGQAYITFCKIEDSAKAKRALNGFSFCGKTLKIDFTKKDAKIVTKYKAMHGSKETATKSAVSVTGPGQISKTSATLFVSNLPSNITMEALYALFSPYRGFKEARQAAGNNNIAFIEFRTDTDAASVKDTLQSYKIDGQSEIKIEFAKT